MDFKRYIFWVVLTVVVLAAVGVWFVFTPSTAETQTQLGKLKDDLETIKKDGNPPTAGKTKAAEEYLRKVKEETAKVAELLKQKGKIDVKNFKKMTKTPPQNSIEFDAWLGEFRKALIETANASDPKVALYADAEKMMFKDTPTEPTHRDETRHIDYRLKHMTVVEEIITTLAETKVRVNEKVPTHETAENNASRQVGAISLDSVNVLTSDKAADAAKKAYLEALSKGGRMVTAPQQEAESDVPCKFMTVEFTFTSHMGAVPTILKQIESSNRYFGVISKLDMQRASGLFPAKDDPRIQKVGAQLPMNTYYLDGPQKVSVSLDVYEYDETRIARAAAAREAAKGANKKK